MSLYASCLSNSFCSCVVGDRVGSSVGCEVGGFDGEGEGSCIPWRPFGCSACGVGGLVGEGLGTDRGLVMWADWGVSGSIQLEFTEAAWSKSSSTKAAALAALLVQCVRVCEYGSYACIEVIADDERN